MTPFVRQTWPTSVRIAQAPAARNHRTATSPHVRDILPKASRTAPHNAIRPITTRTPTSQTVMKGVAIERCLDQSAISGVQAGDLAPVRITLERLAATKVTRMTAITNRTAATGPSP
jgi:hypothetical protein